MNRTTQHPLRNARSAVLAVSGDVHGCTNAAERRMRKSGQPSTVNGGAQ